MKIRIGFVSNSSSASFILDKRYMATDQIRDVLEYSPGPDGWSITDEENFLRGHTTMDNGDIAELFKRIHLDWTAVVTYGDDY